MEKMGGDSADIFVSFAKTDSQWVKGFLLDSLAQAGVVVISQGDFTLGVPQLLQFERAIQRSRRVLLVCSPAYMADAGLEYVNLIAAQYGLDSVTWPVIPLILQPVSLPPRLAILPTLDATTFESQREAVQRLLADLQHAGPDQVIARPPCPFPGMRPFQPEEKAYFCGRNSEINDLILRLRQHPFLTVIGPSGSGKSSLVFAGLLPALEQSSLFGPSTWIVRKLRPGEEPLENLRQALAGIIDLQTPVRVGDLANRILLIVDQFEEIFTLQRENEYTAHTSERQTPLNEAKLFQSKLIELLDLPDFYLLLTARADYYEELMDSPLWELIQAHRFELSPLDDDGLHEAIVTPAEQVNVYVESALVERLVMEASGEPGVLPLLQETLVLLWEHLERRYLPLRAYDQLTLLPRRKYKAIGDEKRTGLQVAMAYHADQALGKLETVEQNMARTIFMRLVQFGDGRAPVRRQQYLSQLSTSGQDARLLENTIEKLADSRLLTLDGGPGHPGRKVDLAHEALITGWDQLAEWIDNGKQAEIARRELEKAAADWEANGHNTSYLFRGAQFRRVRTTMSSDMGIVSVTGQAFLKACQRWMVLTQIATGTTVLLVAVLIFIPLYNWQNENRLRRAASGIQVSFSDSMALLGDDRDPTLRTYPQRPVEVPAFALDKYEVTFRQYRLCVQARRCGPPEEPVGVENFANAPENYPVTWVTPLQAAAFCRWVGGRLPSEAEWERAVRGTNGRLWPWGDGIPTPAHVNVYMDTFPDFAPDSVVAVDDPRFAEGAAPIEEGGLTHLIGNVAEITATPDTCYDSPYDCSALWDGVSKVGGLFVRGMGHADQISANDPAYSFSFTALAAPADPLGYIGFRCAYSQP